MLNIAKRGYQDPSYRYKMPPIQVKVEGRGNGIKTVIVNCVEVAKALHVRPEWVTKYIGIESAAQSKYNPTTERSVINGAHQQQEFQDILYRYIETMILCPKCALPELNIKFGKTKMKIECKACGHSFIRGQTHKIVTFMLKNRMLRKKEGNKSGKEARREKKLKQQEKAQKSRNINIESNNTTIDDDNKKADSNETNQVNNNYNNSTVIDDTELTWHTDISKSSRNLRLEEEFASMAQLENKQVQKIIKQAKLEKEDNASTILKIYIASNINPTITQVLSELKRIQLARDLDENMKSKVLLEALIDSQDITTITTQFEQFASYFQAICIDKSSSLVFLGCIEELVGVINTKLLKKTPFILKTLYETDILDDEILIDWYHAPAENSWLVNMDIATLVKSKAKPFIEWLEQEEESDEESSTE